MYRRNNNIIFSKARISDILHSAYEAIKTTNQKETENFILNANETEYTEYLESKHKLNLPALHFEEVNADSYEAEIPAECFPRSFSVFAGNTYKREIVQFYIPCYR